MNVLKTLRFFITAAVSGVLGLIVGNVLHHFLSPAWVIFSAAALGGNLGPVLVDMFERLARTASGISPQ